MKLTHLIVAALAALGLSLSVQAASAGSVVQNGIAVKEQSQSGVTLVIGKGGPGGHFHSFHHGFPHHGMGHGVPHHGMGHGVPYGARWGWRDGRRGYWYGGVWYWWGPVGVYGGSCYWNCRNAGFGPGYCSAYSFNFCY
jgi:hypothetical protein